MNKIKCECSKTVKEVCTKHKAYLCEKHSINHKKCGLISLKDFKTKDKDNLNDSNYNFYGNLFGNYLENNFDKNLISE